MKALLLLLAITLSGCTGLSLKEPSTEYSGPTVFIQEETIPAAEILNLEGEEHTKVKKRLEGFMPSYSLF